jgi:ComF family protein
MDFDGAQALGYHRGALRELVVSMKHPSQAHLAGYFAEKIASLLSGALPDRIVPVPVPRWEHALAGYSSASELAFRLAKRIGRPCDADLLRKVRSTRKQKELQLRERLSNLRSAFAVSPRRRTTGERILLVDDVLTTGATLSACSVALRDSGAARIECAIVTRG